MIQLDHISVTVYFVITIPSSSAVGELRSSSSNNTPSISSADDKEVGMSRMLTCSNLPAASFRTGL